MSNAEQSIPAADATADADALLHIIERLVRELYPERATLDVHLDSRLEHDLGIDSLARTELLLRLERDLRRNVPEQLAMQAERVRDLLTALRPEYPTALNREVKSVSTPSATDPHPGLPHDARTLNDVLNWYAERSPARICLYLYGENAEPEAISYADMRQRAAHVAAGLRAQDVEPGQCVALMLPTGSDFFYCYYGTLLAGAVPVPLYPPVRLNQMEDHLSRQFGILGNAEATLLITVADALPLARFALAHVASLRAVCTPAQLMSGDDRAQVPCREDQLGLIQYTSGSTGQPKGVALTHANLLANVRAMGEATAATPDDVYVSWLPLYHDMGLIGACFGTLYHGFPLVLLSPLAFIARPRRWLWAIHRHRGTLSAAPNFAYELCARRIDDADIEGLDLSSWRLAFNGAEPVHPQTLERFCTRFAAHGFRREVMSPVYGLAENAVGLAFPPLYRGPRIDAVQREAFAELGDARPAATDDDNALQFVACGLPLPGHEIRIVDGFDHELADRRCGHLQFRGPSATVGYHRNVQATRHLRHGEWLDSGDFAYLADGEVFITGRAKDLIIRGGRNIYPYELEQAIGELPGVGKHAVAVFASTDPDNGRDRLIVLAETRQRSADMQDALRKRITTVAMNLVDGAPDDIVLMPPRTILKTSSGKIRREACRRLYDSGELGRRRSIWLQFIRLSLTGLRPALQRVLRVGGEFAFLAYAYCVFFTLSVLTWTALAVTPSTATCWRIARIGARALFRLTATPLVVRGTENIPADGRFVLAANHASYIDGIVLVAALPLPVASVAKAELRRYLFTRVGLERLGAEFVERFDSRQSLQDSARITQRVRDGHALGFFPEGTFTRAPGLRPFRMGAFVTAAQAGVPILPVSLRGTRAVLRGDNWLPRRGRIEVRFGAPINPAGDDWPAAIALREQTRAEILTHCGEPDLQQFSGSNVI